MLLRNESRVKYSIMIKLVFDDNISKPILVKVAPDASILILLEILKLPNDFAEKLPLKVKSLVVVV